MMTATRRLEVETMGKVTIVSFRDERIVSDDTILEIGEEFRGLASERGRRNIVLNFGRVKAMSSAALSALLFLKKPGGGDPGPTPALVRPPRTEGDLRPAPPQEIPAPLPGP